MKGMFKRKNKDKEQAEQKHDAPQVVFQEAPPDLDLFTTARINLKNFKEYLEQTQENAFEPYQIVNGSLSKAYSNLTNKQSELEAEKENHTKDMTAITADISKQKEAYQSETNEIEALKKSQDEIYQSNQVLKEKIQSQTDKNAKAAKEKVQLAELQEKLKSLRSAVENKQKELETVLTTTKSASDEYESLKQTLADKQKFAAEELIKSEQQVKELQAQAKKQEQIQERQKMKAPERVNSRRRVSMTDRKTETFIIKDNLQLSTAELETLRTLTTQIQKENDVLQGEYESKQMDVDCLFQENLGLKQILRDMFETQ